MGRIITLNSFAVSQWFIHHLGNSTEKSWKIIYNEKNLKILTLQSEMIQQERIGKKRILMQGELEITKMLDKIKLEHKDKDWADIT